MPTPTDVLRIAKAELGNQSGKKYWDFFFKGDMSYVNGASTPYCACYTSWVMDQAKVSVAGLPAAYCPYICRDGVKAGKTVSKYDAQPGDVVLFDWDNDGLSDHVGIVESNFGSYLQTIEGNTNGGQVARRTRYFSNICHVIRPNYDGKEVIAQVSDSDLVVDGWAGPLTITKLQQVLKNPEGYVDGVLSGQAPNQQEYFDHVWSCTWNGLGSYTVERLQDILGLGTSGIWNYYLSVALQERLINNGYSCGPDGADGYFGYNSCCALQRSLNDGVI